MSASNELLRIWQTHLGASREQCDETGRALWDRIEAACAAPRFQWCCSKGCGSCEVKRIEFEYSRTETLRGSLLDSKTSPMLVSACCGATLFIWDNEREQDIDVDIDNVIPQEAQRSHADSASGSPARTDDGQMDNKGIPSHD